MKVQSAKAKGRRFQQEIAADIIGLFPSLTDDDVRSTSMGAQGEDVQLSAAARKLFPYSVEAKNQERLNIWAAIEQGQHNAKQEHVSLTIFKKNKKKPYVALPWKDFLDLVAPHPETPAPQVLLTGARRDVLQRAIAELEQILLEP